MRVEDPPPMVVVPVEAPVLIWVAKLDEWLREMGDPVEERPAKTPTPAAVTPPPVVTSKLVKSIKLVPAVVPDKMVSHPDPTEMALDVEPPVADEMERPVPEVIAVPDREAKMPEVAPLAVILRRPVPV